jgi:hypothetical protein
MADVAPQTGNGEHAFSDAYFYYSLVFMFCRQEKDEQAAKVQVIEVP